MNMFTLSNFISFLRVPLAFLLLVDNVFYRLAAIALAMVSDCLDGYLARRYQATSRLGAVLDPLTDKFFVMFAITIFMYGGYLRLWEAIALLSRDLAVILFGSYLAMRGNWSRFQIQSILFGKISTSLQFIVLMALTMHYHVPGYVYSCFIILGILSFFELCSIERKVRSY